MNSAFSVTTLAQKKAVSPSGGQPVIGEEVLDSWMEGRERRNSKAKHGFRRLSSTESDLSEPEPIREQSVRKNNPFKANIVALCQ